MEPDWNAQWRRARQLVLHSRKLARQGESRAARKAASLAWKQAQYAISRAYRSAALAEVA